MTKLQRMAHELEHACGGRQKLLDAMVLAGDISPEMTALMALLKSPANVDVALTTLTKKAKVNILDLFAHMKGAALARGQLLATLKIGAKTPDIVYDVLKRSVEHEAVCDKCGGAGKRDTRFGEVPCLMCGKTGKVTVVPSLDTQKVALEMGGMLQKGGGVNVQVTNTQNVGLMSFNESFRKFQQDSDEALYPAREIEAGVVEGEETT